MQISQFQDEILSLKSEIDFNNLALRLFRYQASQNSVYSSYINALGKDAEKINSIEEIPFLPIDFFKTHRIVTGNFREEVVFASSGTTGANASSHYVKSEAWYERVFMKAFEHFFGSPRDYCIMALLPSYLERTGSSLVFMVEKLIDETKAEESGFFLRNHGQLAFELKKSEEAKKKSILIGVTFGLLDFAEQFSIRLENTIVMETGGMKGRRKELTRDEVSDILKRAFSVSEIHSEYGMTELMSQAYSKENGVFYSPPWMRFLSREPDDPLKTLYKGRGVLNVIDLANIDSCAFIATQDVGEVFSDKGFKVLGRMDNADIRGCNLLVI